MNESRIGETLPFQSLIVESQKAGKGTRKEEKEKSKYSRDTTNTRRRAPKTVMSTMDRSEDDTRTRETTRETMQDNESKKKKDGTIAPKESGEGKRANDKTEETKRTKRKQPEKKERQKPLERDRAVWEQEEDEPRKEEEKKGPNGKLAQHMNQQISSAPNITKKKKRTRPSKRVREQKGRWWRRDSKPEEVVASRQALTTITMNPRMQKPMLQVEVPQSFESIKSIFKDSGRVNNKQRWTEWRKAQAARQVARQAPSRVERGRFSFS